MEIHSTPLHSPPRSRSGSGSGSGSGSASLLPKSKTLARRCSALSSETLPRILLHQIAQTQLTLLPPNLTSNGNLANPQIGSSPSTVFFFFSSAVSSIRQESRKEHSLIDFFQSYGFTDTQIRRLLSKYLSAVRSPETMKPKLEHLLAFGFSPSELIRAICFCPKILTSSLKERIEPNLSFLDATFGTRTDVIKAINQGPWLLKENLEKHVIPNLKLLRMNGIPMDKIIRLFTRHPLVLGKDPNLIVETINKLKGMGMNPSSSAFICGMRAVATFKKETWERKMELYRSFGWSEEDALSAFSRNPSCMNSSDDKITKTFTFFMEKFHWDSAAVLRWPVVLNYSLSGRLIPRCAVLNVLAKKGLWNGKPNLCSLFSMGEKNFEERFVEKHEKEVPQVIDAYQGKIDFVGFVSTVNVSFFKS